MAKEQERKVKLLEVEPRAFGFPCQCPATELQFPPASTPQSCPYIACSSVLLLIVSDSCVPLLMREIIEQITATIQLGELELMHMFWLSPRWQLSNLLVHFLYETGLELDFSQTTVRVVRPLQAWLHYYSARASAALASTNLLQTWQKIENTQTLLT